MSGIYVDGELSLSAEYWIEQPPGFPTVDLKGAYDPYPPDHLDGALGPHGKPADARLSVAGVTLKSLNLRKGIACEGNRRDHH